MADYCRDCCLALFGMDSRDFAGIYRAEAYSNEPGKESGALVLCECCGPIVVDINGRRISKDFNSDCTCHEQHLSLSGVMK